MLYLCILPCVPDQDCCSLQLLTTMQLRSDTFIFVAFDGHIETSNLFCCLMFVTVQQREEILNLTLYDDFFFDGQLQDFVFYQPFSLTTINTDIIFIHLNSEEREASFLRGRFKWLRFPSLSHASQMDRGKKKSDFNILSPDNSTVLGERSH